MSAFFHKGSTAVSFADMVNVKNAKEEYRNKITTQTFHSQKHSLSERNVSLMHA